MYYVYILKSKKNQSLYCGYTDDLKRRLVEHNKGLSNYTKKFIPWILVYYESYLSEKDARKREVALKKQKNVMYFLKKRISCSIHEG